MDLTRLLENEPEHLSVLLTQITSQLPTLIHYLWMISIVEGSEIRIGIAKALFEVPSLLEALNEVGS